MLGWVHHIFCWTHMHWIMFNCNLQRKPHISKVTYAWQKEYWFHIKIILKGVVKNFHDFSNIFQVAVPIQQSYLWYSSSRGEGQVCDFVFYTTLILVTNKYSTEYVAISDLLSLQDSGAYIFRPHTPPNIVSRSVSFFL